MKKKIQKPFDLEKVKKGARVETRDGKSVRIVCYNRLGTDYSIVALVNHQDSESCDTYTIKGELVKKETSNADLVIVEEVEDTEFKEGDWVWAKNRGGRPWLITAVSNWYEVQDTEGHKNNVDQTTIDNYFRLWTPKDAKPGDILVCEDDGRPFIFKGIFYSSVPTAYCGIDVLNSIRIGTDNPWTYVPIRPATYEERQLLFNKLKEEGYSWNANSLTLSKVQKRWRDDERAQIDGYFINGMSQISFRPGYNTCCYNNLFATRKQAKSALAMARISQIMANDERFGGVVTDKEWIKKPWTTIIKIDNKLTISNRFGYTFLAFHTKEQAELFLKENEDLIKDYYMMN